MTWTVREATSEEGDLAAIARVVNEVMPENPTSLDELRWQDANFPGTRFVGENDGQIVGMATTGRIFIHPPEFPRYWMGITVLGPFRRRGIGSALYRLVSDHARSAGKTGLQTAFSEIHADGIAFLEHRGFTETDRSRMVRLDLTGLDRPDPTLPPGLSLTTLAARPDLVPAVHAVAERAFPDIPTADEPVTAGTLEEFRKRDVDRPGMPPDAFILALEDSTGEVAGYASLMMIPGRTDVAWHDMTAVHPAYRGRGVAKALKRATISWALDAGLTALETGNDAENAPMRAVNLGLGYTPMPDEITFRGPLAGDGPQ